ncbi:MAG: hypothetical protein WDA77_05065 [Acidimicrobiia bacterium]
MNSPRPPVPYRLLTATFTFIVPMVLAVAAILWVRSFAHELPNPVANHWGASGKPDGTGTWQGSITGIVLVTALMCAIGTVIGVSLGRWAATRRLAVFVSMWSAIALPWFVAGGLWQQRGLANALEAPDVYRPMWMAFTLAAVVAGIVAALIPADAPLPATEPLPPEASRASLEPHELANASWTEVIVMPGFHPLAGGGIVATILLALMATWRTLAIASVAALTLAALTLLLVAMGRWTVTINAHGLVASPFFGRPRTRIPLNEIISAEVTTVKPFQEFGGWGYRVGRGGTVGIVIRRGKALKVHRSGQRDLIITIDNAAAGAALLNTLVEHSRQ